MSILYIVLFQYSAILFAWNWHLNIAKFYHVFDDEDHGNPAFDYVQSSATGGT